MKKKLVLVLLAALMVATLALTACGKKSADLTDWDYIEDKGELIVGLDDTFAPMGFHDENDELVGFDIDLANAMSEKLGVKVTFQSIDWDAKEAELKAKNIDCIWNGMSATPERQESMQLSNKYMNNRIVIMSNDGSINIKSSADLANVNIGVQANSAALEALEADENYESFKDKVQAYDTYDDALLAMDSKRVDVVVVDEVYGYYSSSKRGKELHESDFNFGDDFYAVGFRKGDTECAEKFNDALQELIDDGTAEEISNKWFGTNLVINEGYDK